jgi:hypothetical protein
VAISIIPFVPSIGNYDFDTSIDDVAYKFDVHWNEFEQAWYFDIYELDGSVVGLNLKAVIGTYLGRQFAGKHELFRNGVFAVIDTEGGYRDPGFDDFGAGQRVEVRYYPIADLVNEVYAI